MKIKVMDKLIKDHGFNRWTKNEMDRLYISPIKLPIVEVEYYKSGSISSMSVDGKGVAHSSGASILDLKIWVDLKDDTVKIKKTGYISGPNKWAVNAIVEYIKELIEKVEKEIHE